MIKDVRPIVFVVDDHHPTRESLAMLFRVRGFAVATFASAEDFLRSEKPEPRSCIIIDLQLEGMSGIQLYEQLLERRDGRPVIFITGDLSSKDGQRALKLRPAHCLEKPIADRDLLEMVTALFAG